MRATTTSQIIPVILAGGFGERLWPLSRQSYPKQFLTLPVDDPQTNEHSFFQKTLLRTQALKLAPPIIVCQEQHRFLVQHQALECRVAIDCILLEPSAKNTAPAITLAILHCARQSDKTLFWVMPADHLMSPTATIEQALKTSISYAQANHIITFGLTPTYPESGYGYILPEKSNNKIQDHRIFPIAKFIEKPVQSEAKALIKNNALWNSGQFLFNRRTYLQELAKFQPEVLQACEQAYQQSKIDLPFIHIDLNTYEKCPAISIDYAMMEKTQVAVVSPLTIQWADVGSWDASYHLMSKDNNNNAIVGKVEAQNTKNCLLYSPYRQLATHGIENIIVIDTPDACMITQQHNTQAVKELVIKLKEKNKEVVQNPFRVHRPWGWYEVISQGKHFLVKRIRVHPKRQLSLQSHEHRSEHWIVVKGLAKVTKGEKSFILKNNQSTYIAMKEKHRLENPTDDTLEIIEVQSGDWLSEEDITRYEDDFGR